ncbi:MAG: phage regulatory CII family protein [Pseudoxanthomonas sp.]
MNVADAAYAVVHDYPGGSESLAPRLGMSAAILRNKVNPNNTTHHLTLSEAQKLTAITGDARILQASAREMGGVYLDAPTSDDAAASDMAVLELVAAVGGTQGELFTTIHQALADGRLEPAEFQRIKAAGGTAQAKIAALLRRFEGMVER